MRATAMDAIFDCLREHPKGMTRQEVMRALGMETREAGNALGRLRGRGRAVCKFAGRRPARWFATGPKRMQSSDYPDAPLAAEWPAHARFDRPGMIVEPKMRPVPRRPGGDVTARFLGDPMRGK